MALIELRAARNASGLTVMQLAEKMQVGRTVVESRERNPGKLTVDELIAAYDALDENGKAIFFGKEFPFFK